jgi:hypothetical protein
MFSLSYFVSPQELRSMIGTAQPPVILDVRRGNIYDEGLGRPAAARRREAAQLAREGGTR